MDPGRRALKILVPPSDDRKRSAPLIDAPPPRQVRQAADLSRLLVSGAVLVVAVLPAVAALAPTRRMQQGAARCGDRATAGIARWCRRAVQVVAVVAPVVAVGVLVARRRGDAILRIVPAAALGACFRGPSPTWP
ncbi:hypothetical protein ACFC8N_39590 [Streptomyces sp. NPDC055966]|uniref:hypothetical protein n=1 Tax=Streptomyces sp. NPDC055966 TaxID=3345669 RepID=UPI0035DE91A4